MTEQTLVHRRAVLPDPAVTPSVKEEDPARRTSADTLPLASVERRPSVLPSTSGVGQSFFTSPTVVLAFVAKAVVLVPGSTSIVHAALKFPRGWNNGFLLSNFVDVTSSCRFVLNRARVSKCY